MSAYLDECAIPSLWQDSIKLMKIGEHAKIECFKHEDSFHLRDGFDEKFNCFYDSPELSLKFIRVIEGGPLYEMDEDDKLKMAIRMKNVGTALYKANLYLKAIEKYDIGLGALSPVKEHIEKYKETYISLQLNVALSFFKLKDYRQCIVRADRVLEIEPDEFRTIFRKGMAYKMMFEFQNANECFAKGKEIAENKLQTVSVQDFEREIKHVAELVEVYHKKEKKLYSNLFK
jgi:tetratricopeptide (TPR) repeat protein